MGRSGSRGKMPQPRRPGGSRQRRNRQGPFNSSSPLGPLRHQEKSESTKQEKEKEKAEKEDWGVDPQELAGGPWSGAGSFLCRLCFLKQATYPL